MNFLVYEENFFSAAAAKIKVTGSSKDASRDQKQQDARCCCRDSSRENSIAIAWASATMQGRRQQQ